MFVLLLDAELKYEDHTTVPVDFNFYMNPSVLPSLEDCLALTTGKRLDEV